MVRSVRTAISLLPVLVVGLVGTAAGLEVTPEEAAHALVRESCGVAPIDPAAAWLASKQPGEPRLAQGPGARRIVCRFFVVRRADGSGGVDEALIPKMMQDLNYGFRDTDFYFVREPGVSYVDNDAYYANFPDYASEVPLVNSGFSNGVLSWYIVPLIFGGMFPAGTWVGPPYTSGLRGILMGYAHTGTPTNMVTPTHEMGHIGILHHPFETAFGADCVSGFNCAGRGDLVCDTPASPGLGPGNVRGTGVYYGTALGPCSGDGPYAPNPRLYMDSSGPPGHLYRDQFSPGQIARFTNGILSQQSDLFGPARPVFTVDCDGDGLDDPTEILAGNVLDVNRDMVPDVCQTFPAPGDLMVCGMTPSNLNRPRYFDGITGQYRGEIWNGLAWAHQLRMGPDQLVYMPALTVLYRLDLETGRNHDNFLDGAANGAGTFVDLLFEPSGNILLLDNTSSRILRYDGATGAFLGVFSTLGGMTAPKYMEYGPDGNIYVVATGAQGNTVRRFDAATGAPLGAFVAAYSGGLVKGQGLTFHGGHLYVSEGAGSKIVRYDALTGEFVGVFVANGSGGLDNPHSLRFGPDGHLYVASRGTNSVKRYDGVTGAYLGDFVAPGAGGNPGSGGVEAPAGILFVPPAPAVHVGSEPAIPESFRLAGARPNPTSGATRIRYVLPRDARVEVAVYDISGGRVRDLGKADRNAGAHEIVWDGRDDDRRPMAAGVYFVRVTVDRVSATRRVLIVP